MKTSSTLRPSSASQTFPYLPLSDVQVQSLDKENRVPPTPAQHPTAATLMPANGKLTVVTMATVEAMSSRFQNVNHLFKHVRYRSPTQSALLKALYEKVQFHVKWVRAQDCKQIVLDLLT